MAFCRPRGLAVFLFCTGPVGLESTVIERALSAEVSGLQAAIEGLRQELALSWETIRCARNLAAALRMSDAASLTDQVGNGTITLVLKREDVISGPRA